MKIMRLLLASTGLVAVALAHAAEPPEYPARPVKLVVPYSAGSGMDLLARVIGQELGSRMRQPFVIENKPGAAGNLGTSLVARAAPDGQTLLMQISTLVINPSIYRNLGWSPQKDFQPVALVARGTPVALAVSPGVDARSVPALVALAKAQPKRLNYASPGVGTPQQIAMELFMRRTGIELLHVPFRSTADIFSQMMAGEVHITFLPIHLAVPQARQGKLRILAVDGARRWPDSPDVPTFSELGLGEVEVAPWYGILAPAGTPAAVVARLNAEINEIVRNPVTKASLLAKGFQAVAQTPQEFADLMRQDQAKWQQVVKEVGVVAE